MKRLLVFVFDFYIQSSIHVAIAVVSLLYVFTVSLKVPCDIDLIGALFFGSITGYNFVKYASVAKLHHRSLTRSLKIIQLFSLFCFLMMCFYAAQLPFRTLSVFGLIGLLTFLYAVPFIASKNMRSISGLKIYVVALSWVLAVVVSPTIHYNLNFESIIFIKIIQIFCLVVALIIPFDIRDLAYDTDYLKTIPQRLGVQKAKWITFVLMFFIGLLEVYFQGIVYGILLLPMCLLVITLVNVMPLKAHKYYCSFWIEGGPIFYALIIFNTFDLLFK